VDAGTARRWLVCKFLVLGTLTCRDNDSDQINEQLILKLRNIMQIQYARLKFFLF